MIFYTFIFLKNDGSLIIFPLKYARNKIFGTIGIDTMQEKIKTNTFYEHELAFYQVSFNRISKSSVTLE